MELLSEIKKSENTIFLSGISLLAMVFKTIATLISRLLSSGLESMTIIIVKADDIRAPHHLKIRRITFWLAIIIPLVLIIISTLAASARLGKIQELETITEKLHDSDSELDAIRDVAAQFIQKGIPFRDSLDTVLSELSSNGMASLGLSFTGISGLGVGYGAARPLSEIAGLAEIRMLFEKAQGKIEASGILIANRQDVLAKVPSLWPISGDRGHITTNFGPETNPFTGQAYLHKGLDISNARIGDPVIATADGVIISSGFDSIYGNNVVIRHKYGYTTRYGHMNTLKVRKGQKVAQRDVIGLVGNTGLTTGPHVHYEVFLAGKLVNPMDYIDLAGPPPSFAR